MARDGAQEYAFTYADGEVRHSGNVPGALEPSRFFGDLRNVAEAERPLLEAVAREFGAGLPRHAITSGRLHTFTTRSWTRPPGDGETYAVIRKQCHRGTAWDRGDGPGRGDGARRRAAVRRVSLGHWGESPRDRRRTGQESAHPYRGTRQTH
ncbi:hypothetical protein [Streptomyces calvus]|uniref:hypothetical protein n=1 Tax=Streptomyces calvus TaxID=67282 RepID=UPI00371EF0C3